MNKKNKLLLAAVLISLGVFCRILPHAWNFAPIAGIALFSGAYLGRRFGLIVPLASMLIGDFFLGFYAWPLMLSVYGSYLLIGFCAPWLLKNKNLENTLAAAILSAVVFFLATNWAVWQFTPWFEKSLAGLLECYYVALPFFRATILGDLFYSSVLIGGFELAIYLKKSADKVFQPVK